MIHLTITQIFIAFAFVLCVGIILYFAIFKKMNSDSSKSIQHDIDNVKMSLSIIKSNDISSSTNCLKESLSTGSNEKSITSITNTLLSLSSKIKSTVMKSIDKQSLLDQITELQKQTSFVKGLSLCSTLCSSNSVYNSSTNECDVNPSTYASSINNVTTDLNTVITNHVTTIPKGITQGGVTPTPPPPPPAPVPTPKTGGRNCPTGSKYVEPLKLCMQTDDIYKCKPGFTTGNNKQGKCASTPT